MSCPICFFRDSFQRTLKIRTFGKSRFELKLVNYKAIFIEELENLRPLNECSCGKQYGNSILANWIDEFLADLKGNIQLVSQTFDSIIGCYLKYISASPHAATSHLIELLNDTNLIERTIDSSELVTTMFRARWRGDYDSQNINEYFHIPFLMRHLVSSQRFSISGLPMLYFGSSILTVEKELEGNFEELYYSAFVPSYSHIYNFKIFNLKNSINDLLENSLPGLIDGGVDYPYSGEGNFAFNKRFKRELQAFILLQISTFPTESKGKFIPEYVIPQTLTSALQESGFQGLSFTSTKCFKNLVDNHRFSSHHINVVMFTEYSAENDYDQNLLSKFYKYTYKTGTPVTVEELLIEIEKVVELNKSTDKNNNDFVVPLVRIKLQIEYLEKSRIEQVDYFSSQTGQVELSLYMQVAKSMYKKVKDRVK